ncbi:MAG: sodium/substrate symporter small subunit, partial [Pseudomonadota bacterium]
MKDYNISTDSDANARDYWQASIRLIFTCLAIWFVVSYGF